MNNTSETLADLDIQNVIRSPKLIIEKDPSRGYKEEKGHKRCNLKLESTKENDKSFIVFIRQNSVFLENFSIGLRYQTNDKSLGNVTLVRFNGPHGERSLNQDGHYAKPHIHRITAADISSGNVQPQESHIEITKNYVTFEEALSAFFLEVGVTNYRSYFPSATQLGLSFP